MVYKPKEIPEGINVTSVHPLVNFAYLLGTVVVFSALVYLGLGVIADQLVTRMSPKMEAKIGQQLLSTQYFDPILCQAKAIFRRFVKLSLYAKRQSFYSANYSYTKE